MAIHIRRREFMFTLGQRSRSMANVGAEHLLKITTVH